MPSDGIDLVVLEARNELEAQHPNGVPDDLQEAFSAATTDILGSADAQEKMKTIGIMYFWGILVKKKMDIFRRRSDRGRREVELHLDPSAKPGVTPLNAFFAKDEAKQQIDLHNRLRDGMKGLSLIQHTIITLRYYKTPARSRKTIYDIILRWTKTRPHAVALGWLRSAGEGEKSNNVASQERAALRRLREMLDKPPN